MSFKRCVWLPGIFVLVLAFASPTVWPAQATTQSTRYTVIVPPGMQSITIAGRTAICPPDFADAVRKGLAQITPATRPTTMASDLLPRLAAQRSELLRQMTADLLVSQSDAAKFLDKSLTPVLQNMTGLQPRAFVVVATQEQITAAMKTGWHAPCFHYNPLADHTFYELRISVTTDKDMDDVVLWAPVEAGASPDDVTASVVKAVERFEKVFVDAAGDQSMTEVRNGFAEFIAVEVILPLKQPAGQQWLGIGLMRTMACKYAAMVTGLGRHQLVDALMAADPSNPLQPSPIDLLNGFDPSSIKPQFMPFYVDAVKRKATAVVQKLLDAKGDAVVPQILTALKSGPIADNQTLVRLIQNASGVDLTSDLLPH